jgi:hypothetical protein
MFARWPRVLLPSIAAHLLSNPSAPENVEKTYWPILPEPCTLTRLSTAQRPGYRMDSVRKDFRSETS